MRNAGSRAVLLLLSIGSVVVAAALPLIACGGDGKPVAQPTKPATSAGGSASAGAGLALSPPPSGLPPLAPMPPPGVAGSKKAKKKTDAALYACGGGAKPSAKDPAALVKQLGEACATTAKMKPVGAMIRAQQADRDAHQEHKVRVEANKCYRVVFATEENVKDAVVVMRDSAGDVVAESPGAALPEDGAVCFTSSDEVTLLIGIGTGKGAYAAQVWSD
jgi:hypothetical protein